MCRVDMLGNNAVFDRTAYQPLAAEPQPVRERSARVLVSLRAGHHRLTSSVWGRGRADLSAKNLFLGQSLEHHAASAAGLGRHTLNDASEPRFLGLLMTGDCRRRPCWFEHADENLSRFLQPTRVTLLCLQRGP